MNSLFLKIKNLYKLINRGILKVSDWIVNGFKVALVLGVVLYGVGIGWFVFYADKVSLEDHTVLVMDLKGVLVEETPGGLKDQFIGELQGNATETVRLRDVVMTLELAATDKHIDKVLLSLTIFRAVAWFLCVRRPSPLKNSKRLASKWWLGLAFMTNANII